MSLNGRTPAAPNAGKQIRLSRLFEPRSGNSLTVTVGHGLLRGPIEGEGRAADLASGLPRLAGAGMDAVIVSPGFLGAKAEYLTGRPAPGIILWLEWTNMFRDVDACLGYREGRSCQIGTVEDALRLGADAVGTYIFIGSEDPETEAEHVRWNAAISRDCERLGMARVIETMARGANVDTGAEQKKEYVELHSRIAYEIGCDVIKTEWTGDIESFHGVVEAAPVPVLVAGGPRTEPVEAFRLAEHAMQAGARGIVFGRNVVQARDREAVVRGLGMVVHEAASAEEAAIQTGQVEVAV
jgi:DhnA family fructose-bisphosphate aldolase class Ia